MRSVLKTVRIIELKDGDPTGRTVSYQYLPEIYRPNVALLKEEVERQIGYDGKDRMSTYMYVKNNTDDMLYPLKDDNLGNYVKYKHICIYVERAYRALNADKLDFSRYKVDGIDDASTLINEGKLNTPEQVRDYLAKIRNFARGVGPERVPEYSSTAKCARCSNSVEPVWRINKITLEAFCEKDAEAMIRSGEASAENFETVHTSVAFKYQSSFLRLKREFSNVPDNRIRELLLLNKGNENNARDVLRSKYADPRLLPH